MAINEKKLKETLKLMHLEQELQLIAMRGLKEEVSELLKRVKVLEREGEK